MTKARRKPVDLTRLIHLLRASLLPYHDIESVFAYLLAVDRGVRVMQARRKRLCEARERALKHERPGDIPRRRVKKGKSMRTIDRRLA